MTRPIGILSSKNKSGLISSYIPEREHYKLSLYYIPVHKHSFAVLYYVHE